jgi:integration host factor subunit beta
LTKSDLVERLRALGPRLSRSDAERAVTVVLKFIAEALAESKRVELRGFGVFTVKSRPVRVGRNPRSGETLTIQAKNAPHFRTGKELRHRMNGQPEHLSTDMHSG